MYYDIAYDTDAEVEKVTIRPDKNEDPDTLHYYSKILKVTNPTMRFMDMAKKGQFNCYTEEDYCVILSSIKEFDRLFFHQKMSVNVFQLLANMTEYIFQNYCFVDRDEPDKPEKAEDESGSDTYKGPWD